MRCVWITNPPSPIVQWNKNHTDCMWISFHNGDSLIGTEYHMRCLWIWDVRVGGAGAKNARPPRAEYPFAKYERVFQGIALPLPLRSGRGKAIPLITKS